jgi:hypothetical protein
MGIFGQSVAYDGMVRRTGSTSGWLKGVELQVTLLRAMVVGSQTCFAMQSLDCRCLSAFCSCRGYRLCTIEEDRAHNACTVQTDGLAWPLGRAIIGRRLDGYNINGDVLSEDDKGCGSSTNSHIDCL